MKILALPGSLRPDSSSNLVLNAIATMMPAHVSFKIYQGIGTLPHFNDAAEPSTEVTNFRKEIHDADAVLICTPEYAFGVPGSLKNALDWTVGSGEFMNKPVSLITASSHGEKGHPAMLLILQAIAATVIEDATLLISFIRAKLDDKGNIKDAETLSRVRKAVDALVNHKKITDTESLELG